MQTSYYHAIADAGSIINASDRTQSVKLSGYFSTRDSLNQEVPQGSIHGPLFFNIFIKDIFIIIAAGSCVLLQITFSASCIEGLNKLVKINTTKCTEWFNYNLMTANKSKCQSMVVSKQHTNIDEFVVKNELKIKVSDTVALLGVKIDNRLKFDSHN